MSKKSSDTVTISKAEYESFKSLKEHCAQLESELKWLKEQLLINKKKAKKKAFGSSSERLDDLYQGISLLFNEAELIEDIDEKPAETTVKEHTRKKKTGCFDKLPENIETYTVEHENIETYTVEHELSEEQRKCPECGEEMEVIGKKVTKHLEIIPAKAVIREDVYFTYACKKCHEDEADTPVVETPQPNPVIKGSFVLHADETTLQVLRTREKPTATKSYMWLYRTSGCCKAPIVLYDYRPNRKAENAENFLKEFKGYLHTDGYKAYRSIDDVTIVGCWAHARRRFCEALEILPEEQRKDSTAAIGLDYCGKLYAIEKKTKDERPENRLKERQEQAKPLLDAFFAWAKSLRNIAPKSKLGKAVNYLIEEETYLRRYIEDGRLEIDNNRAERSIFVIGRKNWLFANTPSGAKASATAFSIIETAKENGLDPYEYLKYVFTKAPNLKENESIDILLPWNAPDCYRSKATHSTE